MMLLLVAYLAGGFVTMAFARWHSPVDYLLASLLWPVVVVVMGIAETQRLWKRWRG